MTTLFGHALRPALIVQAAFCTALTHPSWPWHLATAAVQLMGEKMCIMIMMIPNFSDGHHGGISAQLMRCHDGCMSVLCGTFHAQRELDHLDFHA